MRFLFLMQCFLPFLTLSQACAVDAVNVISGDEISVSDGSIIRLAGIKTVASEAKEYLDTVISGKSVMLEEITKDRYGRSEAVAFLNAQTDTIQEFLLREGLAYIYPPVPCNRIDAFRMAEASAREGKKGLWAQPLEKSPDVAAALCGKYSIVAGIVTSAVRVKNKIVLSYGDQKRPDLNVILSLSHARALRKEGFDPLLSQEKKIRIRGWVSCGGIPSITPTDRYQLEAVKQSH